MTHYSITNIKPKNLTDTRGRVALDARGQPLTEGMASYLLGLSASPKFCSGLNYLGAVRFRAEFTRDLHEQAGAGAPTLSLQPEAFRRIVDVLNEGALLNVDWATLHCYADLNDAIVNARKVEAEATAEPIPAAAE